MPRIRSVATAAKTATHSLSSAASAVDRRAFLAATGAVSSPRASATPSGRAAATPPRAAPPPSRSPAPRASHPPRP